MDVLSCRTLGLVVFCGRRPDVRISCCRKPGQEVFCRRVKPDVSICFLSCFSVTDLNLAEDTSRRFLIGYELLCDRAWDLFHFPSEPL